MPNAALFVRVQADPADALSFVLVFPAPIARRGIAFSTDFTGNWAKSLHDAGLDKDMGKIIFYLSGIAGLAKVSVQTDSIAITAKPKQNVFGPVTAAIQTALGRTVMFGVGAASVKEISKYPSRVDLEITGVILDNFETSFDRGWDKILSSLNDHTRELVSQLAQKNRVLRLKITGNRLSVFVEYGVDDIQPFVERVVKRSQREKDPQHIRFRELSSRL